MAMTTNNDKRLKKHPVLHTKRGEKLDFRWKGKNYSGFAGETIMSALVAAGENTFGTHEKDGFGLGIFCANGQCSQCTVLVDGIPVKSCMVLLRQGMDIRPCNGLPELPQDNRASHTTASIPVRKVDALIIGAGPSGLAAADELGAAGANTLIVDDKATPGGKLVLQTHKFFGSISDCMAGSRGIDIGTILAEKALAHQSVSLCSQAAVVSIFSDRRAGIELFGSTPGYMLVEPKILVIAAGAREKGLAVPGGTLPGVFGAGAFQTLVNRDLIRCSSRIFIVGGGNVGLIAGYHALQAGINVAGLAEAMPECGGYKVHEDKLVRHGVPVYTSHTVLNITGSAHVEGVNTIQVNQDFEPVPGTEKHFDVDTVLIAVGLEPVNEFTVQAQEAGLPCEVVGDSLEIAEASAAIFSGRIGGRKALHRLGLDIDIPADWNQKAEILKSRPGKTIVPEIKTDADVFPVIHCFQEIPCNPCATVCPQGSIYVDDGLMGVPEFRGKCNGCLKCVAICPGLAISLVRRKGDMAEVTLASELIPESYPEGTAVTILDCFGAELGFARLIKTVSPAAFNRTNMVTLSVSFEIATRVAGFRFDKDNSAESRSNSCHSSTESEAPAICCSTTENEDPVICRCERVRKAEILQALEEGVVDLNQVKSRTRAGMGACGGKTCQPMIRAIARQQGINPVDNTIRPLFSEVSMSVLAGECSGGDKGREEPEA